MVASSHYKINLHAFLRSVSRANQSLNASNWSFAALDSEIVCESWSPRFGGAQVEPPLRFS